MVQETYFECNTNWNCLSGLLRSSCRNEKLHWSLKRAKTYRVALKCVNLQGFLGLDSGIIFQIRFVDWKSWFMVLNTAPLEILIIVFIYACDNLPVYSSHYEICCWNVLNTQTFCLSCILFFSYIEENIISNFAEGIICLSLYLTVLKLFFSYSCLWYFLILTNHLLLD